MDGWYAPSLRGLKPDDVVALLKSGRSQHAAVAGPMSDVVAHSTQYLSDDDLKAIAQYVHSLEIEAPKPVATTAASSASMASGGQIYAMYCSTCHGNKGEGSDNVIPALAGNLSVTADNPLTALRVVLEGAHTPVTQHATAIVMPGYGWVLNDQEGCRSDELSARELGEPGCAGNAEQVRDAWKRTK
ncbi:G3-ADH subunit II [Serratia fonticola]|uniref:G3-ADH subunit II n=1 Tax=Serratia fonticola TaxID=47917 RepID=A0A4U9V2E2_SERFO|nr:G3-ADH subunit II [Serratia fonticola]